MRSSPEVPESVRQKAHAVGPEGEQWVGALADLIAQLETEWGIVSGETIAGGSSAYVARALTTGGEECVLKVAIPDGLDGNSPFATELDTLLVDGGATCVDVLRFDRARHALLLERLGRPLGAIRLPVEEQIEVIATTLIPFWRKVPQATWLRTGAEQARFLGEFIRRTWEEVGRPCAARTVQQAERYSRERFDAFDSSTAVVIHGDAHPANVLEVVGTAGSSRRFKLIDPDGLLSEPAHDLAIPLRDWSDELLAADPVEVGLLWCAELGARASVNPSSIWEWAFVERVSTGLFLTRLGDPKGDRLLKVADEWAAVEPAS